MFEPFSERNMEDYPDRHFELNEKIRYQIFFTLMERVGLGLLDRGRKDFRERHGYDFSNCNKIRNEEVLEFIKEDEPLEIFDFIELTLNHASTNTYNEAVPRLNKWFELSGYGYEIRNGKFEKVDSEYLKEETTKPALSLLQKHEFKGALSEFEDAIVHQRNDEFEDAIKKANDSFESTMKEILEKSNISFSENDTASVLIDKLCDDEILDPQLVSFANSLRATLESGLPTIRNRTPGAGHGRGQETEDVSHSYCNFAIHLAGSIIVFLIERFEQVH